MAKLKVKGFVLKPSQKVEMGKGGRFFRLRQESPSRFQKGSFRIKDVGGVKLVVARPVGSKTTVTQSILVDKRLLRQ